MAKATRPAKFPSVPSCASSCALTTAPCRGATVGCSPAWSPNALTIPSPTRSSGMPAANRRGGITKPVHPHTLRHCFATHMLDNGAELPVIQVLLGHDDPRDTMIYLHLSTRKLKSAPSPLQTFDLSGQTGQEPAAS